MSFTCLREPVMRWMPPLDRRACCLSFLRIQKATKHVLFMAAPRWSPPKEMTRRKQIQPLTRFFHLIWSRAEVRRTYMISTHKNFV